MYLLESIVPILLLASITATTEGPDLSIDDAMLRQEKGVLLYAGRPFTGRLIGRGDAGQILSAIGYHDGKLHGLSAQFYPDRSPREVRWYSEGRKEGWHSGWWENGLRRFSYHFQDDLHEGTAREWFREEGFAAREATYVDGREAGPQVLYEEDGTVRANYVVKDGRRYGSLGAKPCR